jgi:hypothetical protein
MKLTDDLQDALIFQGMQLVLNLAFDIVLRARELQDDNAFSQWEKVDILCEMYVMNYDAIKEFDIEIKSEIVQAIYKSFIDDVNDDEDENKENSKKRSEPVFDFDQDAEIIYASFLYDYGIDLYEQQGKLHWKKFLALLSSLSEKSPLGKIIGIRTAKLPKRTKENVEERSRLQELKRLYALKPKTRDQQIKALDDKMSAFANRLTKRGGTTNVRR